MPRRASQCLIVKDEEANLPACLGSAADLVGRESGGTAVGQR
jgi:hypothetical protein